MRIKPLQPTAAGFCHLGGFARVQQGSLHARLQVSGQPLGVSSCDGSMQTTKGNVCKTPLRILSRCSRTAR